MAVNKTVNKRTNSHGAMRNCIEYVLRQDKASEQLAYVTGPYCHDAINYDLVYQTFLEEKKLWIVSEETKCLFQELIRDMDLVWLQYSQHLMS